MTTGQSEAIETFTHEDSVAIAAIDLTVIKTVLPENQFKALAKFVGCVGAYVSVCEKGQQQ